MSEIPASPRERMLREAELEAEEAAPYQPQRADDPIVQKMAEAAEAAAQERDQSTSGPDIPEGSVQVETETPEILTLQEIEVQLQRLDYLMEHIDTIPPGEINMAADDALQGALVVLSLGFVGDVQMLVLAVLQRYREIKRYR